MSPTHQRQLNVDHFERLLARENDPDRRASISRLLEEERSKPDNAYPEHSLRGPCQPGI